MGDAITASPHEPGCHLLGGRRRALSEGGAHGLELLWQLPRPGLPRNRPGGGRNGQLPLEWHRADAGLELGAQPADPAAPLFLGALAIKAHETGKQIFVAKIDGPTIGVENGAVEIVMQTLEHKDKAAVVDIALPRCQWGAQDDLGENASSSELLNILKLSRNYG